MVRETSCKKRYIQEAPKFYILQQNKFTKHTVGSWIIKNNIEWTREWDWFDTNSKEFIYYHEAPLIWRRHLKTITNITHTIKNITYQIYLKRPYLGSQLNLEERMTPTQRILHSENTPIITKISYFGDISFVNPEINWFNKYLEYSANTSALKHHLCQGAVVIVSDRYFYPNEQVGACAWIVASPDGKELIQGGRVIPSKHRD